VGWGLAQQLSDIELNSDEFLHDQNTALSEDLRLCPVPQNLDMHVLED
jgi:hypothetical protein